MKVTDNKRSTNKTLQKAGFVGILGAPNVGKSTLVNSLVGEKVSIVTDKVQTTRFQIRGIYIEKESQVILIDTPGIFTPQRRFDQAMVKSAWTGARDADYQLHVIDALSEHHVQIGKKRGDSLKAHQDTQLVMEGLKSFKKQACMAINKIDLIPRDFLLGIAETLDKTGLYDRIFMVSAKKNQGVEDLKQYLAQKIPENHWFYPEDQLADLPSRLLAAELTREKLFLRLYKELPYDIMVETVLWREMRDQSLRIEQVIYVNRKSQKPILIGEKGRTIKSIGQSARMEMQKTFGKTIHLFLQVKIKENWDQHSRNFTSIGLKYQ